MCNFCFSTDLFVFVFTISFVSIVVKDYRIGLNIIIDLSIFEKEIVTLLKVKAISKALKAKFIVIAFQNNTEKKPI